MILRYNHNKKGSIIDVIGVMMALIVMVVAFFVGTLIFNEFQTSDILTQYNATTNIMNEGAWVYNNMGDNLIMLLFVGMAISTIISAVLSKAHPIFMYLSIIISIFMIVIAVIVSNWYGEFSQNEIIQPLLVNYPHTDFIMSHMPLLSICIIFVVGISLYMARGRNAQIQL